MNQRVRKFLWIGMGGVVIVGGLAMAYFSGLIRPPAAAGAQTYQTALVKRDAIVASVSATGAVRASQTANVSWQASGTLGEVKVGLGQTVKKDEVLMVLDTASTSQTLIQAQNDLISAQKALQDLYDQSPSKLAQAQKSLAQAEKDLSDAQRKRNWLNSDTRADEFTIQKAEADYYLALDQVDKTQEAFDNTAALDAEAPERAQAQGNLATAQSKARQAKWMLDYYRGKPDANEIAQADAAVQVAKAAIEDAKRQISQIQSGPDLKDVTQAKNRVTIAEKSSSQNQLKAPFQGTITSINQHPGDSVAVNSVGLRMDNLDVLYVDCQVNEVDINRVKPGQPVKLTFDAIGGDGYSGKVTEVGAAGTNSSGAVNFPVTVQMANSDGRVKPGMTAGVTITTEQLDGVLTVPSRAVRTVDGKRVVYVLSGTANLTLKAVELGASAESMVEITNGDIKEGDRVVLNPPAEDLKMGPNGGNGAMNMVR